MEISTLISETVACLRESFKWKNDKTATIADKVFLTVYIDFVKQKVLANNEKSVALLNEFEHDFTNLKMEGKIETIIENALENNKELHEELEKKITELQEYFLEKKSIQKGEETKQVKSEIIQEPEKKSEQLQINDEKTEVSEQNNQNSEQDEEEENFEDEEVYLLKEDGTILVPWDFSDIAEIALSHAVQFSKTFKGEINLVHIVKKDKEIPKAIEQIKKTLEDINNKYHVKPNYIIREGTIFNTITEIAQQTKAKMVVMGTHGMKGMQKLTGSWALKVIVGTTSPFVVVQQNPHSDQIKRILFPVDHTKESRQKLKQAEIIAKVYPHAKFDILRLANVSPEAFERITTTNVNYAKSFFRQMDIKHDVITLDGSNLADAVVKFAPKSKADLIMILTTKNISLTDFMIGPDEQKIIFNEAKIPVMCINPRKGIYRGYTGFGASTS